MCHVMVAPTRPVATLIHTTCDSSETVLAAGAEMNQKIPKPEILYILNKIKWKLLFQYDTSV